MSAKTAAYLETQVRSGWLCDFISFIFSAVIAFSRFDLQSLSVPPLPSRKCSTSDLRPQRFNPATHTHHVSVASHLLPGRRLLRAAVHASVAHEIGDQVNRVACTQYAGHHDDVIIRRGQSVCARATCAVRCADRLLTLIAMRSLTHTHTHALCARFIPQSFQLRYCGVRESGIAANLQCEAHQPGERVRLRPVRVRPHSPRIHPHFIPGNCINVLRGASA